MIQPSAISDLRQICQKSTVNVAMKTWTHQTDPKMIREARLTTRSGSWYSPIPRHAASGDLITYPCMLVQTSSHSHVHVHVCIQARAAVAWDIFHFRQRGQTTWACIYIPCMYTRCYILQASHPRVISMHTAIGCILIATFWK